jgi:hypothetical protein
MVGAHLIKKLLDGCDLVLDLVGAMTKKLHKIRAKLYHYNFTIYQNEYNMEPNDTGS